MKTLLLVRHAKSSWATPGLEDFNRPLNDRGKQDAPVMADRLLKRKIKIDAFISSPAKRALKTATRFLKTYGLKKDAVVLAEDLYHAGHQDFLAVIAEAKNKWETIAIFSHNPGITTFASSLTDIRIDNMPTCAVFAVQVNTDDWKQFEEASKSFLFFDYPKATS
jgi:phosphohistidine phosphatase